LHDNSFRSHGLFYLGLNHQRLTAATLHRFKKKIEAKKSGWSVFGLSLTIPKGANETNADKSGTLIVELNVLFVWYEE